MIRLAVIFNNYSTFGHARVVFSLLKSLKSVYGSKIEVRIIEIGIRKTGIFPFNRYASYSFLALPVNSDDSAYAGINESNKKRFSRIKFLLKKFKPQLLLTEFYPFCQDSSWLGFEAVLKFVKEELNSKIICSSFYPDWSGRTKKVFDEYYDLLLLHLPGELSDIYEAHLVRENLNSLLDFLKTHGGKIHYTGFLVDRCFSKRSALTMRKSLNLGSRKLIVVSRGGQKAYRQIILDSLRLADKRPDWFFLIQQDSDFCALPGLISRLDNARIMKLDYPDSERYMQEADVNINLSGYNTMVRLLCLGRNSVTFPLNHSEQRWNAYLLYRFSKSKVINIKEITPVLLEEKINKIIASNLLPQAKLKKRWFSGDKYCADMIIKLCLQTQG